LRGSSRPSICLVLARSSCEALRQAASIATGQGPDLIEIRLDALGTVRRDELEWVRDLAVPVIGTLRPSWEGGAYRGGEEERLGMLQELADLFDFVDLELRAADPGIVPALKQHGPRLLISHHDFRATPDWQRLTYLYKTGKERGGDVVKIATRVRSKGDLMRLLSLHTWAMDLVIVPMGKEARIGRVLAPVFGSLFTYASMDGVPAVAPGMMTISEMREVYRGLAGLIPGENRW
jgi:3-dehydroquinate dehydratase-1